MIRSAVTLPISCERTEQGLCVTLYVVLRSSYFGVCRRNPPTLRLLLLILPQPPQYSSHPRPMNILIVMTARLF